MSLSIQGSATNTLPSQYPLVSINNALGYVSYLHAKIFLAAFLVADHAFRSLHVLHNDGFTVMPRATLLLLA